jgi:hypothetical protein
VQPNATQLLVNAELGARYLEVKRAISNCRDMSEPDKEGYISRFNFPFIATLPLELTDELIKAVPDRHAVSQPFLRCSFRLC